MKTKCWMSGGFACLVAGLAAGCGGAPETEASDSHPAETAAAAAPGGRGPASLPSDPGPEAAGPGPVVEVTVELPMAHSPGTHEERAMLEEARPEHLESEPVAMAAAESGEFLMLEELAEMVEEPMPTFPWPPPRASVSEKLPPAWFAEENTFGDVSELLSKSLRAAGHRTVDYYEIPGGFALVSQLEQIDKEGVSLEAPDRWSVEIPPLRGFNLREYFSRLFKGAKGHYRVVVFLVTPNRMPRPDARPTIDEAEEWVGHGALELAPSIEVRPWHEDVKCWAFIYEFVKDSEEDDAHVADPGSWNTLTHLDRGQILEHIER